MAQRKPEEKLTVDQVLKLVEQLAAEEQQEVLEQLKLGELRREIQKGIESADRGELYTEEEVMAFLDEYHKQRQEK